MIIDLIMLINRNFSGVRCSQLCGPERVGKPSDMNDKGKKGDEREIRPAHDVRPALRCSSAGGYNFITL